MKKYRYTLLLSLLTPLLLLPVVFLMGGGHGYYTPAVVLFPFGMMGTVFQQTISPPFVILAIVQFPIYGFLIDRFENKKTVYCITGIHVLTAVLTLVLTNFND